MVKSITRRLAIIPAALLLVHFSGYAYAHQARPLRAARNPFLARSAEVEALWPTYAAHLKQALRLDFGPMPTIRPGTSATIAEAVLQAGEASLGLLALALLASAALGLLLGLRAASADPPSVAAWLTTASTAGMAMPGFFIGGLFFAAWFLYARLSGPGQTLPLPLQGFGWDAHMIMPVLVLTLRPVVQIARLTASLLSDELGKQYVVTARSIGLTWRAIRWNHALRNIIAPVVLTTAGAIRLLVGEMIVVEWLFNWPGLGSLLAQTLIPSGLAVSAGRLSPESPMFLNPPLVALVLTCFAALFLFTDLLAATLAQAFDPRYRDE